MPVADIPPERFVFRRGVLYNKQAREAGIFSRIKRGYRPIGDAARTVNLLYEKGHEISLCSYAHKSRSGFIRSVVGFYGMKYTKIVCRLWGGTYGEIVERVKPKLLIEDDCRSIGGPKKCCITGVSAEIKRNIRSIILPEFAGIDKIDFDALTLP